MPNRSSKPSPPSPPSRPTPPPAPKEAEAPITDLRAVLARILKSCPKDLHGFLGNATPEHLQEYHDARIAGEQALRADALRKR